MFPSVFSILGKCVGMAGENGDVIAIATMTATVIGTDTSLARMKLYFSLPLIILVFDL